MVDNLGGRTIREDGCKNDCESEEEFNQKSALFKKKWDEMEKESEKKNLKFTKFFVKHKEEELRDKMSKYTRKHAGMAGGLELNPIEWLHYMAKIEIDKNG